MLRDALGRITSRTEAYGAATNAFEYLYDLSGRLTEVKLGGVTTSQYGYDGNSNRTTQTIGSVTTSATYNSRDELLTFGTKSYTYNANGERISMTDSASSQTTAYGYDTFGNLRSVTLPGGSVITYLLNANGQRVAKKVGSTVQMYYMYGKNGELVATVNPNKTVNTRFVYGIRSHVPDYIIKGTTKYQLVKNHLGSPVQVVDAATGTIAQEIAYDEWGRIISDSSPGFQPFGFAGCKYDVDTQLCNFVAREYDASTGRWLSKDPILFAGEDSNLYGYVLGDPINLIDPSGLNQEQVDAAIRWLATSHPEIAINSKRIYDFKMDGNTEGFAGPGFILIDTSAISSQAGIVNAVAHELIHRNDGFWNNVWNAYSHPAAYDMRHGQIHNIGNSIQQEYEDRGCQ